MWLVVRALACSFLDHDGEDGDDEAAKHVPDFGLSLGAQIHFTKLVLRMLLKTSTVVFKLSHRPGRSGCGAEASRYCANA